jgi:enoyl-CoA hydratase/carnithine racemase
MAVMDNQPEFLSERIGALLRLTINRPRAANAINEVVAQGIVSGLDQASRNDDIRAVILTGSGDRIFSAGRDLKNPQNLKLEAFNKRRREELRAYTEALLSFEKPLVVALNGVAMGAGLMLALHADRVVAAEHAAITLPEIDIGIATFLGHALVAVLAGDGVANEFVLTGRRIAAAEALHRGLVHLVVSSDRLALEAEASATMFAAKPIETFREMKGWILKRRRAAVIAAFQAHDVLDANKRAALAV